MSVNRKNLYIKISIYTTKLYFPRPYKEQRPASGRGRGFRRSLAGRVPRDPRPRGRGSHDCGYAHEEHGARRAPSARKVTRALLVARVAAA